MRCNLISSLFPKLFGIFSIIRIDCHVNPTIDLVLSHLSIVSLTLALFVPSHSTTVLMYFIVHIASSLRLTIKSTFILFLVPFYVYVLSAIPFFAHSPIAQRFSCLLILICLYANHIFHPIIINAVCVYPVVC